MKFINKQTGSNKPNLWDWFCILVAKILITLFYGQSWASWKRATVTLDRYEYTVEFDNEPETSPGVK